MATSGMRKSIRQWRSWVRCALCCGVGTVKVAHRCVMRRAGQGQIKDNDRSFLSAARCSMKIPSGLQPLIDEGVIDAVLRPLKSGKEAAVYVVRAGEEVDRKSVV